MSSTNPPFFFYHVKIIVFHTCSLVDFDFAIFHLEGRSNEKSVHWWRFKKNVKREKSFKCKRLGVGGGQG